MNRSTTRGFRSGPRAACAIGFALLLGACNASRSSNKARDAAPPDTSNRAQLHPPLGQVALGSPRSDADAGSSSDRRCRTEGFQLIEPLPVGCEGVCSADSPATALPKLTWKAHDAWCAGCTVLETPWATTQEEKDNAVDGVMRAVGPEPSLLRVAIPRVDGGLVGIYDAAGSAVAGYSVAIQRDGEPCGRLASLKFSKAGELGAHLLERVDTAQTFFKARNSDTKGLFNQEPSFVWPTSIMQGQTVNDMWFSDSTLAIDAAGVVVIAELRTGVATRAFELPGAITTGDYFSAEVFGADVFVARKIEGRTEWWVRREGRLEPFLADESRDVRELVTDGRSLIWIEGREPAPAPPDSPHAVQYEKYLVMKAPYTTRASELAPEVLLTGVPRDFGRLVTANGFVSGIYLVSHPVYRAGAIVIDLQSGTARRSELPQGYSWGYELYPTAAALLGPVTPGPMISFETIARVPYQTMTVIQPG